MTIHSCAQYTTQANHKSYIMQFFFFCKGKSNTLEVLILVFYGTRQPVECSPCLGLIF